MHFPCPLCKEQLTSKEQTISHYREKHPDTGKIRIGRETYDLTGEQHDSKPTTDRAD